MNKYIGSAIIVAILGFVGVIVITKTGETPNKVSSKSESLMQDKQKEKTSKQSESMMQGDYKGKVLAGIGSPFIEFNQEDYEKAKKEGKVIVLDFYANWCPVCRAEGPELHAGFNELASDKVVGFRVNYNDSDTNDSEKKLAKYFGITYQHTKVILKDGEVVLKTQDEWDKQTFLAELEVITE